MKTNRRGFLKTLGLAGTVAVAPVGKSVEKTQKKIAKEKHPMGWVKSSGRMQVMKTSTRIGVSVEPFYDLDQWPFLQGLDKKGAGWVTLYRISNKGAHIWLRGNGYKSIRLVLNKNIHNLETMTVLEQINL